MKYLLGIITLLAASAAAAAAAITAAPSGQDSQKTAGPYHDAEITITNTGDQIIRMITVRAAEGGPTILKPAVVAPQTGQKIFVTLPVLSQEQAYTISLYADEERQSPLESPHEVRIKWPVESIDIRAFIDLPSYTEQFDTLPDWPQRLRAGLLTAATLMGIALGGIMFIRKAAFRCVLLILIVAAAAIVMWKVPATYNSVIVTGDETGRDVIVKCRRTSQWTTKDKTLTPVYYSRDHIAEDNAVIGPNGLSVTIRPDEVRIFRRWKIASEK